MAVGPGQQDGGAAREGFDVVRHVPESTPDLGGDATLAAVVSTGTAL
jgi:hypothetical protein